MKSNKKIPIKYCIRELSYFDDNLVFDYIFPDVFDTIELAEIGVQALKKMNKIFEPPFEHIYIIEMKLE